MTNEAQTVKEIANKIGKNSLKPEVAKENPFLVTEVGLGKILAELWNEGINPVDVAIKAMEEANHHTEANILRYFINMSEFQKKDFAKSID